MNRSRQPSLQRSAAAIGVMDSLVSSGVLFLAQLALIAYAAKEQYGVYSLLISYVLVGQMVLSAAFGGPLITALTGYGKEARANALRAASRWQALSVAIVSLMGVPLLSVTLPNLSVLELLGTIVAFFGLALREMQRTAWTIMSRPERSLFGTLVFGGAWLAVASAIIFCGGQLRAGEMLLAIGATALLVAVGPLVRVVIHPSRGGFSLRTEVLKHTRWAIPGVILIWIQNNLYLTIIAAMVGVAGVAEVSAARMIAIPYLVASLSIARINQIKFGALLDQDPTAVATAIRKWMVAHLIIGASSSLVLIVAHTVGFQALLPAGYPHVLGLGSLWMLFAGVSCARGVMSSLYQAEGRYRELFLMIFGSLPLLFGTMIILIPHLGLYGAIIPLLIGEIELLILLLWGRKRRR